MITVLIPGPLTDVLYIGDFDWSLACKRDKLIFSSPRTWTQSLSLNSQLFIRTDVDHSCGTRALLLQRYRSQRFLQCVPCRSDGSTVQLCQRQRRPTSSVLPRTSTVFMPSFTFLRLAFAVSFAHILIVNSGVSFYNGLNHRLDPPYFRLCVTFPHRLRFLSCFTLSKVEILHVTLLVKHVFLCMWVLTQSS